MIQIAVLISGGGTNLQAIIDGVANGSLDGEIACVISNRSQAYGLVRAHQAGIPTYILKEGTEILGVLQAHQVDIVVLAGYLALVDKEIVAAYPNRIVNIHPSLIPAFSGQGFYGSKVHQAAIDRGVKVSGATVHLVNEEYDQGEILIQETVPVFATDTAEDLASRVLEVEHEILVQGVQSLIDQIQGGKHA